ncbi:MAG: ComEC/Rec2 family competence protein [Phycisphaerae bacterium]|nr:ComEC/Rec2 family competence protein [Phycisphaerae bacterium]
MKAHVQETGKQREKHSLTRCPPAPLLLPALGLIAGVVFDDWCGAGAGPYLFGMLLGVVLLIRPFTRWEGVRIIVVLVAFCIGGLMHLGQMRRLPADHILAYTHDEPILARITGTVLTQPRLPSRRRHLFAPWWHGVGRTSFLIDADSIETNDSPKSCTGTVKVSVKEPIMTLAVSDRVELFGWCYRPWPPGNPGQFDWACYEHRRGVFVNITCNHRECVRKPAGKDEDHPVISRWARLRQRVRALLLDEMLATGGPETSLLDTMVLGRRGAIDPQINEAFIRIGCAHYLAVSGMHVGMLALFVWFGGRALGIGVRGGAAAVIVITVLYALVADPRPPILRATVMTVAVCAGLIVGRPANFLNGLSLAAIIIILVRPAQVFDPGFQFSFSSVLAIVYLSPQLMHIPHHWRPAVVRLAQEDGIDLFVASTPGSAVQRTWRRLELRVYWMWSASMAAWLVCAPLALVYFHRVSPWGWLASLLLFPFVFAVMAASFIKLLCALVWPTLASLLTSPVYWLAAVLIKVVEGLEHLLALPPHLSAPPWWLTVLIGIALLAWAWQRRWAKGRRITWIAIGIVVVGLVIWLMPRRGDGRLTMTVLSVGRGTSVVLELPDGRVVLYDAGASGSYDPGAATIVPFLRHRRIDRVDAVLISHPNLDHFSGLPTVLKHIPTGPVYLTRYFERLSTAGKPSRALLEELSAGKHSMEIMGKGCNPLVFGDVTFEALWPPADMMGEIENNETSIVIRITYAGRSILLTGDIEELGQGRLLAEGDLCADVLLLPHHGSLRHNTLEFVEAVAPDILIRSSFVRSADQGFGYEPIIAHRRYFNTADHGAVTVTLDQAGIEVQTHRARRTGLR